jgi:hypothetical protein
MGMEQAALSQHSLDSQDDSQLDSLDDCLEPEITDSRGRVSSEDDTSHLGHKSDARDASHHELPNEPPPLAIQRALPADFLEARSLIDSLARVCAESCPTPRPEGSQNPCPDTWQRDARGNLTRAGDVFSASYDDAGNLAKVVLGDTTFERVGPDQVKQTIQSNSGKKYSTTMSGVTSMKASEYSGNFRGPYAGAQVSIKKGTSEYSLSQNLYQSAPHQGAVNDFWNRRRCDRCRKD